MSISGRTRVIGIIGDPVAHSLSPAMHNAAFGALALDYAYVAFHVRPEDLRAAIAGARALDVVGLNVTVPHKERVIAYLDSVSAAARHTGAVNTIVNRRGRLHGENTDVAGFLRALDEAKFRMRGGRVLVVGAGGAARAVLTALTAGKAAHVTIANRTLNRAQRLSRVCASRRTPMAATGLDALRDPRLLAGVTLVVNTTSVGLRGERFPRLACAASPRGTLFFDLIPAADTPFLAAAARVGRATLDGRSMLLHQGAAAFRLWTGRAAPLAIMRAALERADLHSKLTRP